MLGLEVNAGAGGLICQQRKEGVKDTSCLNTPVLSGSGHTQAANLSTPPHWGISDNMFAALSASPTRLWSGSISS